MILPRTPVKWSIRRIYISNWGGVKGRNQRNEIEIKLGSGVLKLNPANFGRNTFSWRDKTISLDNLVEALDKAVKKGRGQGV